MEDHTFTILIRNWLYIPAFLMAVGFPEQMAWSMTALTTLMVIDFITGIAAAAKIDGFRSITSRRATAGVVSKLIILCIPLIIGLTGKGMCMDFSRYVQGAISILVLSEAYSNIGNIQSYITEKRVPEYDAISMLLKQIRKIIVKLLEKGKVE